MITMNRAEWEYVLSLYRTLRTGLKAKANFPVLIEVQTVNRCNAKCPVCPYPYTIGQQPYELMSDERYEHILQECAREPAFQAMVLAFQNEPFVDPYLIDRARRFKKVMPTKHLQVVTNGSRLTPELLPQVYDVFDLVSISVNAHSALVYETVMAGLHWSRIQNVMTQVAARPDWREKTIVRFIKQRENIHELAAFKKYWNRAGFRVFGYDINDRVGDLQNFSGLEIPMTLGRRGYLATLKLLSQMLTSTCPIPFISFYIRANGETVLCFNDYADHRTLGAIGPSSIQEVFNSPRYRAIRADALQGRLDKHEPCCHCSFYRDGVWLTV